VPTGVLLPGTTYFYRVVATNAKAEKAEGEVQSFTTVPTATAEAVTALTATTATFNGHLTPLNPTVATQYRFAYNLTSGAGACTGESSTQTEEAGTGAATEAKAAALVTGLEPNHEYAVCLVASNAYGSEETPAAHFTTPAVPPKIDSESISAVTPTEATLEAQINPNNQEVTYGFEYATNEALTGATSVPGAAPLTGFPDQLASVALTGLEAGKTYFYRVVVENQTNPEAVIDGPVRSFTPQGPPLSVTGEAQSVTRTSAALTGTVNPAGAETSFYFVYVPAAHYLPGAGECPTGFACAYAQGRATAGESAGAGYTAEPAGPVAIAELTPGETYDYALVATSSQGVTVGPNMSFTAGAPTPPTASTGAAEAVTQTSATVTGSVDTRGLPTTLQFEVGPSPEHGSLTFVAAGAGSGTVVPVSLSYSGVLAPATTYYYRVIATNHDGAAYGAERSFTTSAFPAALVPQLFALLPVPPTPVSTEPKPPPVKPASRPPTRAQKLAKALKACAKKPKRERPACRRQAKRKYG
jgi:hypothetical protein